MSDDIESNSLGRVYSLWLLARELGYESRVYHCQGVTTWGPVRASRFAQDLVDLSPSDSTAPWTDWNPDLVIPVKCLPSSYGQAMRWNVEPQRPVLLDVDDPDAEAALALDSPLKRTAKWILRNSEMREVTRLRRSAPSESVMVSNPSLASHYGGTVIPHVRHDRGAGREPVSAKPTIAFVGTNRSHKGTPLLRAAVAESQRWRY